MKCMITIEEANSIVKQVHPVQLEDGEFPETYFNTFADNDGFIVFDFLVYSSQEIPEIIKLILQRDDVESDQIEDMCDGVRLTTYRKEI